MEQFLKPINDYFGKYIIVTLEGNSTIQFPKIHKTIEEAIEYVKSQNGYIPFDSPTTMEAIEKGNTDEYKENLIEGLDQMKTYNFVTVFGIDINKRIYLNIDPNCHIRDHKMSNVFTNDLNLWKKWMKTDDEPWSFYYSDYEK